MVAFMNPFGDMLNEPSVMPSKFVLPSGWAGNVSCDHPQPPAQMAAPDAGMVSKPSTIPSLVRPVPLNEPPPVPSPLSVNPTLHTPFTGMQSAIVNVDDVVVPAVSA